MRGDELDVEDRVKVLFVGGTGNLSSACSREALTRGVELVHLNRGTKAPPMEGVETIVGDIANEAAVASALRGRRFDAVVDFIAMNEEDLGRSLRLFAGCAKQYVFISTASVHREPPIKSLVKETTRPGNPHWPYAQAKVEAERALREAAPRLGLGFTIARPGHTYGPSWVPTPFGSSDFTLVERMLALKEVPVPGDGQAVWTLTNARDFAVGLVGLLGRPEALGEDFLVAGDEALTWDEIYEAIAAAFGVEARLVHVPTDFIARLWPPFGEKLLGDKAWSTRYDCSKLHALVPEFRVRTPFAEGIRESAAWLMGDSGRRPCVPGSEEAFELILSRWKAAMDSAVAGHEEG